MFRWKAIKGPPLYEFFRGIEKMTLSCAEANMFLAEDRVMCLEILIKRKNKFYLKYIPDAKAITDSPEKLNILIKQRRRWNNGSLFGTYNTVKNVVPFISCSRTSHSFYFKFKLFFFMIYYIINFMFSLVVAGGLYAACSILFGTLFKDGSDAVFPIKGIDPEVISYGLKIVYSLMCFLTMVASLT
jgi:chitin synthase